MPMCTQGGRGLSAAIYRRQERKTEHGLDVDANASMDQKARAANATRVDGQGVPPAGQFTQVAVVADVAPAGP